MPSTETLPKQCNLWNELSKILDRCADENGPYGCEICNMLNDCERWHEKVNKRLISGKSLQAHEFSEYMREHQRLKSLKVLPYSPKNALSNIHCQ
jgi:hypothetical protein